MSKLYAAVLLTAIALPMAAEEFKDVPVVDLMCSAKSKGHPDAHTRSCALQCNRSGYGVYTRDGKFLKFDGNGNAKMAELLKSSNKADHLRVNVRGEAQGDTVKVQTLSLI